MMTTPEHIHLAINHLPFIGSGIALIPIVVGIILRNKATLITGLAIAAVAGWLTPVVMFTGEEAAERYEDGPIREFLDPQAEDALETHEHRAETWSKVMYASAVISTVTLLLAVWKLSIALRVSLLAALLCAGSLLSGIWIAEAGGKIRRPDFRSERTAGTERTDHRGELDDD